MKLRIVVTEDKYWTILITIMITTAILCYPLYLELWEPPYETRREWRTHQGNAVLFCIIIIIISIAVTASVFKICQDRKGD